MSLLFVYVIIFLGFIFISMPIAFSLGIASMVTFLITERSFDILVQRMWTGLNTFTLVAIPLFILTGELMGRSGILTRLLDFARLIVGRLKGSLLYINILVSMLFGGVNGSAVADTSAVGSMLIPATKKEYKDPELVAGVTAHSSVVGPIIPPSLPMLIYATAAGNVSLAALFMAGIVPGILLGLGFMLATFFLVRKTNYESLARSYSIKEVMKIIYWFLIAIILPVIMVAGIVGGIFTPTEAGCIGIVYALIIGFFVTRELKISDVYKSFFRTIIISSIVMLMISVGNITIWWLAVEGYPEMISNFFVSFTENEYVFLLLMLCLLLFVGLFIEQAAAMIMLAPVFAPLAVSYGVDPVHFGLVTCLALALGLVTPPVGLCLFVSSNIAQVSLGSVFKRSMPYLTVATTVLVIVTFLPELYLWVPKLFGFQ